METFHPSRMINNREKANAPVGDMLVAMRSDALAGVGFLSDGETIHGGPRASGPKNRRCPRAYPEWRSGHYSKQRDVAVT